MLAAARADLSRVIAERERIEEERAKAERESRELHARLESAFDHAPIGMALVDREGRWLEVNDALCRITGYTRNALKATTLRDITVPEDLYLEDQANEDMLKGRLSSYQLEKRYRHARGHHIWVLLTVSLVRDEEGRSRYVISQVQDISQRKELAERLEYLVDHDFLTGLFNRRRFERELTTEAQRVSRYDLPGAVVLIDLDNFKTVNDALGHEAGDDLLVAVAGALRQRMRETDVVARVGGDEFAVILPQTDALHARIVAEEIVASLRREVEDGGNAPIRVTASVGLALFDGHTAAELLRHADLAMYEAKAAGRDRFSMYRAADGCKARGPARPARSSR